MMNDVSSFNLDLAFGICSLVFVLCRMKELVIASNNQGKIREMKVLLKDISLLSLQDIGFNSEIEEPYDSFEENAQAKAGTIFEYCGKNVFAEDSGICVEVLNGAPGVFSARYAGSPSNDKKNLDLVLENMKGEANRKAFYKAVICLIWEGKTYFFEGICRGHLLEAPRGEGGFGYDPIFVPDGFDETFAEIPLDVKNQISHRGKALQAMIGFLNTVSN